MMDWLPKDFESKTNWEQLISIYFISDFV
jgi:hypothetical protein